MLLDWALALRATSLSHFIRESDTAFPWLECAHVIAISMVFGMVLYIDLRLMNLASRRQSVSSMLKMLLPITFGSFGLAALTGGLLFLCQPDKYLFLAAFQLKMLFIALAALNTGYFHYWVKDNIAQWDNAATLPASVRFSGAISIVLWISVLFAGRFMGFMLEP